MRMALTVDLTYERDFYLSKIDAIAAEALERIRPSWKIPIHQRKLQRALEDESWSERGVVFHRAETDAKKEDAIEDARIKSRSEIRAAQSPIKMAAVVNSFYATVAQEG